MDNTEYNDMLRREYEKTGSISVLEKYVVSETISPIEDYYNAMQIIRANYSRSVSCHLLMIGAHIFSEWCFDSSENDFLDLLNDMYPFLPSAEKGIVNFLNAHHMRFHDRDYYQEDPKYEAFLLQSITENKSCVMSRIYLAELYLRHSKTNALKLFNDAALHIRKVSSMEDLAQMTDEDLATSEAYINEHILGTHVSFVNYDILLDKIKALL